MKHEMKPLGMAQTQVTGWVACFRGLPAHSCGIKLLIGRESMAPSCYPISTPLPLDTGTVDGNRWRKLLFPNVFRQPDPLSKAVGQWVPVGQWISPTRVSYLFVPYAIRAIRGEI